MPAPKKYHTEEERIAAKKARQSRYYHRHRERILDMARKKSKTPEDRRRRREYLQNYRRANREKCNAWAREYQKTEKRKAKRIEYLRKPETVARILALARVRYYRNHEKQLSKNKSYKRRNAEKVNEQSRARSSIQAEELSDNYIKMLLVRRGFTRDECNSELIKTQRVIIKAKREIYYNGNKQPCGTEVRTVRGYRAREERPCVCGAGDGDHQRGGQDHQHAAVGDGLLQAVQNHAPSVQVPDGR